MCAAFYCLKKCADVDVLFLVSDSFGYWVLSHKHVFILVQCYTTLVRGKAIMIAVGIASI